MEPTSISSLCQKMSDYLVLSKKRKLNRKMGTEDHRSGTGALYYSDRIDPINYDNNCLYGVGVDRRNRKTVFVFDENGRAEVESLRLSSVPRDNRICIGRDRTTIKIRVTISNRTETLELYHGDEDQVNLQLFIGSRMYGHLFTEVQWYNFDGDSPVVLDSEASSTQVLEASKEPNPNPSPPLH